MEKRKKSLIVYNPTSGHAISEDILNIYRKTLDERGYDVSIIPTEREGHATEIVRDADDVDIVFSIGGDGTLNEVVKGNYLREKKIPICPISAGTCNDVASMLGYGKDPIKNLNIALDGIVEQVDIGMLNGDSPFAYVVGMGYFMNIPYETKGVDKRKNGYLAYIKAALPEIINKLKRYRTEVEVDGQKIDGSYSLIMVSNSNHIAGIDGFHKDVCLDDGEMEVLLCKSGSKRQFIKNFLMHFLGRDTDEIISLKGHDVSIKLLDKPDKNWCIDGEKLAYDGSEYKISVGKKMPFVTATGKNKKLFKKTDEVCKA